jgi:hypothetical protein
MRLLLAAVLLTIAATTTTRDITIIGVDEKNPLSGRVLVPHIPPVIYVKQTAGTLLPEKGSVSCHWHEETKDTVPHIVGDCEGGVQLLVTGMDLNY